MAVDTTGKWWSGSEPDDIRFFLEAYAKDAYAVDDFRLAHCSCGSHAFRLLADDEAGVAKRSCTACPAAPFICDSSEYWDESEPEEWRCVECDSDVANIGVGFSFYPESRDIRWLYVGVRCAACSVLGCFAGWKIGYADPTLLDRA